jgi:hypothetical protein
MAVMSMNAQHFSPMAKRKDARKNWTPAGQKLDEALDAREITPADFGRMLVEDGLKSGYQLLRNWRAGRGFGEDNKKRCIRLLNTLPGERFPQNYFDDEAPESEGSRPPALSVRNPDLAALLNSDRRLRESTIEALLALDKVWTAGAQYWLTQADLHEAMAAMSELHQPATSPKTPVVLARRKRARS